MFATPPEYEIENHSLQKKNIYPSHLEVVHAWHPLMNLRSINGKRCEDILNDSIEEGFHPSSGTSSIFVPVFSVFLPYHSHSPLLHIRSRCHLGRPPEEVPLFSLVPMPLMVRSFSIIDLPLLSTFPSNSLKLLEWEGIKCSDILSLIFFRLYNVVPVFSPYPFIDRVFQCYVLSMSIPYGDISV